MAVDWVSVGAGLGAAGASFLGTWVALVRPAKNDVSDLRRLTARHTDLEALKKELGEKLEALKKEHTDLRESHSVLESRVDQGSDSTTSNSQKIDKLADRVRECVTLEEFHTHTQETSRSVQTLTEKVGAVVGAVNAWRDQR